MGALSIGGGAISRTQMTRGAVKKPTGSLKMKASAKLSSGSKLSNNPTQKSTKTVSGGY